MKNGNKENNKETGIRSGKDENENKRLKEYMKIVIVGHVDHGKSTLIGRLFYDTKSLPESVMDEVRAICKAQGKDVEFAYVLDSLEEEREQNITIDTTQSFFRTPKREYAIIDAPGHKEFIKNMITGASQADTALLIVDVNEGVKEQTKRHAYLLDMLGLRQFIVVMNKMDLVDYSEERFDAVKEELIGFFSALKLIPTHIIPVSAKLGDNIAEKSKNIGWYSGPTVLEALDKFELKKSGSKKALRMPVQDVYKINDKRILAGRIESGTLRQGDEIIFFPSGKTSRIKAVEMFNEDRKEAEQGECIGVTIDDPLFIERGEILCRKGEHEPKTTSILNANIFWMAKDDLNKKTRLVLKCATQEHECSIQSINKRIDSSTLSLIEENSSILKPTEVGEVLIKTDRPIAIENFSDCEELGRFVLIDGYDTAAGGIMRDNDIQ